MRINITIDEQSLKELDKQAQKESRSRSAHIRELVKEAKLMRKMRGAE